jgi:hypothetical protein
MSQLLLMGIDVIGARLKRLGRHRVSYLPMQVGGRGQLLTLAATAGAVSMVMPATNVEFWAEQ